MGEGSSQELGKVFVGQGESDARFFIHPITNRQFEWSEQGTSPESRVLMLCDRTVMPEGTYQRALFDGFFPDSRPAKPFNISAIKRQEEFALDHMQRGLRRILLEAYGYEPLNKKGAPSVRDNPALNIGFTDNEGALANSLNTVGPIERLKYVAQTDQRATMVPEYVAKERGIQPVTRHQHSQHLALNIAKTHFRLAIKQPELYLERVETDNLRYKKAYKKMYGKDAEFTIGPRPGTERELHHVMKQMDMNEIQKEAVMTAYEYTKYHIVYAYLHDMPTPAFGDVVMKAHARAEGQQGVNFSEDAELVSLADQLPDEYHLAHIIKEHNLDPDLLVLMVKRLATEADDCLGGYLIKDKRKWKEGEGNAPFLPPYASLDGDQESGTITNIAHLAAQYLPGGFRHLGKEDQPPIGDTETRAQLLLYQVLNDVPLDVMRDAARDLGLDPNLLYFTAEEFMIGPNVMLATYRHNGYSEVLPVPADPGAVKRLSLMMNIAYGAYYLGPSYAPIELLTQDMITFGLGQNLFNEELFRQRSDYDASQRLNRIAPYIVDTMNNLQTGTTTTILTEADMARMTEEDFASCLITEHPAPRFVNQKEGTLTIDHSGEVGVAKSVLSVRLADKKEGNGEKQNPFSLPSRLDGLDAYTRQGRFFYMIKLDEEDRKIIHNMFRKIDRYVDEPQQENSRDVLRRSLELWLRPIQMGERTITPGLRSTFLGE